MKKANANAGTDEMRSDYARDDFGPMVRGKYAKRLQDASNVVLIEPELHKAFPNAKAVNDALRGLLELARRAGSRTKSAAG